MNNGIFRQVISGLKLNKFKYWLLGSRLLLRFFVAGLNQGKIREDLLLSQIEYAEGIASTYRNDPGGLIPIDNSSGGLLKRIALLAEEYSTPAEYQNYMLITEPDSGVDVFANWYQKSFEKTISVTTLDIALKTDWNAGEFEVDLANPELNLDGVAKQNVIISQSLLEHVVDPVQVLRNLKKLLKPNGIISLQTCNPFITLHRYPVDCLRFYPDFFLGLESYVGLKCLHVENVHGSIYVVLKNV
jgi:SAM-dependent methyltransferase